MWRPRVKPEHRPVRHGTDRVRIGGIVPGIAADIRDPDGWVWALLGLLDGSRVVDQVVADLVHRFPTHPADEVREAIVDLDRAGYLEDAAEPAPTGLSAAELLRYERGLGMWRWMDRAAWSSSWKTQLLLRRSRVVVIGIGGVGCTAALDLVASGIGRLHCVEPDVVELSNLNRQILFTEGDLGRPKVQAAVQRLKEYNSDIHITGEQHRVDGPAAIRELAASSDVLLLAADEPQHIRSWANQACWATGTAWVHGGYHGPLVNIGVYRPSVGGPCYDCAYAAEREHIAAQPKRTFWTADTSPPHAASAVSAGIAGHLAAHAVMSLITGVPALRVNRQFGVSLVTLQDCYALGPDAPHPGCPTCGPHRARHR
ncbi:HesA/MoeB/ThiF family protein [Pseudonocardia acaciae]|uniref:HesA/MoeB/ThiF family protein n=1 Tax=Pseudonocardia acaciae TaxID=551276 RepID=UPI0005684EF1|nr:ThiF family adenylyltransferase [Pseudonocardia acaciae]